MLKSFELCMAWAATSLSTENLAAFLVYVCGAEGEANPDDPQQHINLYMRKFEDLIDSELPAGKEKLDKNEKMKATRGGILVNGKRLSIPFSDILSSSVSLSYRSFAPVYRRR
jgi:hypothetical protein